VVEHFRPLCVVSPPIAPLEAGFFVSDIISGGLLGHLAWPWAPTIRW